MGSKKRQFSCIDCGVLNCYRRGRRFPGQCLTSSLEEKEKEDIVGLYKKAGFVSEMAYGAAEIEGKYYGRLARVEEIILFAKRISVTNDKAEIGILDGLKVVKGSFEAICNPVEQARILNKKKTGLNVIVGLCVGHDSLFIKYLKAPVTTLITKDRVLGHNPAAALYTSRFYYKRLLQTDEPKH